LATLIDKADSQTGKPVRPGLIHPRLFALPSSPRLFISIVIYLPLNSKRAAAFQHQPQTQGRSFSKMPKHIDHADEEEPSAIPSKSGGSLARKYEYLMFYFFAVSAWGLEIASGCLGSLYGGESHYFIATVSPFLACYWYATRNPFPRRSY
jgi:hypothetical protein